MCVCVCEFLESACLFLCCLVLFCVWVIVSSFMFVVVCLYVCVLVWVLCMCSFFYYDFMIVYECVGLCVCLCRFVYMRGG